MVYHKDKTMPVTFNLDDDVSLTSQPLIMDLRRNGFKGVSRTFLLNSALRHLVKKYKESGIDGVVVIINQDYKDKINKNV